MWLTTGLDASFLHVESATAPMHTLKVLVFRRRSGAAPVRDALIGAIEAQLPALAALRVRPRAAALGRIAWEPVCVVVSDHVSHAVVRSDGQRRRALDALAARPLPRHRPLWEVLALEDPRRGELVVAVKIHHALADGKAAARMLEIAAGVATGEPVPARPPPRGWVIALSGLLALPAVIAGSLTALVRAAVRARDLGARPPLPFSGAPTSLAGPVTSERRVAFATLPLDALARLRCDAGVTLNDVVMALATGALRRYLGRRGERIDRPLTAAMPIGAAREPYAFGNRLSTVLVPLHVEERDPASRLRRAASSAAKAKALHATLGADLLGRWSEVLPGWVLRGVWVLVRGSRRAAVDVIVSNVPGPREPIALGGARLERLYSVGPLLETTGLNLTFWSYAGRLHVGVLTSERGDAHAIAADLLEALDELLAGAASQPFAAAA